MALVKMTPKPSVKSVKSLKSDPEAPVKPAKAAAKKSPVPAEKKSPGLKTAAPKKPTVKSKKAVEVATVEPGVAPEPLLLETPKPPAPPKKPGKPESLAPHVSTALQAVQEGKAVELVFLDAETNPPRTFEPRHLLFDTLSQAWYVWGWDRRYNAERHHRLDQMAEVNLVEGPGRSAQGPYKEGTPANRLGGWLGGEPIPVKAMLMKQWIFAVKQAPPAFPEFKVEDAEDGKAMVSFTATDLRAIARWCLQFGEGIQVLEPQRLVDRIKQVGVTWAGKTVTVTAAPPPVPKLAPMPQPRPEPKPEPKPEHRPEHRSENRPDHRREHGKDREEAPKKAPKVEVRIERL